MSPSLARQRSARIGTLKKEQQLGMRISKAAYWLTRQILFRLVQELHRDTCFRCTEKIERLEDFSLEHKKAWLDVDLALFWDLENIAFSHRWCNSGASRSANKRVGPKGTSWCKTCSAFLPVAEFYSSKQTWNGLYRQCKSCKQKANERRYE